MIERKTKKCIQCGKDYIPRYPKIQKCCSKRCRSKYDAKNNQAINRKYRLGQHDGTFSTIKRDYPKDNLCEICHNKKLLVYHHWDNIQHYPNITKGIWICKKCHQIISCFERPAWIKIFDKYKQIRYLIDLNSNTVINRNQSNS